MAHFPELIENAVLGEVHANRLDGEASTVSRYYAVMRLDTGLYVVKITAMQEPGKAVSRADVDSIERIYDLSLTKKMENARHVKEDPQTSEYPSGTVQPAPGKENIPGVVTGVKQSHTLFSVLEGLKESAEPKQQMLIQEKGAGRN